MKALWAGEKGQHMAQFVLMLPLLVAFMGLVVDVGNAYVHQRLAQNAADAAATAGGMVLYERGTAAAESAARYYAAQNGYHGDGVHDSIAISWPSQCIRVQIDENVTPVFAAIVWNGTFRVRATAASCYRITDVSSSVLVLDPHACSALDITGGGEVRVTKGNIHVNSDCDRAIDMSGHGTLITETPTSYVGGCRETGGSEISPAPVRASVMADPLANLPVPSVCSACSSRENERVNRGEHTFSPTCHMGGIDISGGDVTFEPGVYCIGEDGLKITGKARVSGSRVFFYILDGGFDLSGDTRIDLSPPTSGDYDGVLIFQARNSQADSHFSGQAALDGISGIVYLPSAQLKVTGGASSRMNLVVGTLAVAGGASLDIQGSTGPNWQTVEDSLTE